MPYKQHQYFYRGPSILRKKSLNFELSLNFWLRVSFMPPDCTLVVYSNPTKETGQDRQDSDTQDRIDRTGILRLKYIRFSACITCTLVETCNTW